MVRRRPCLLLLGCCLAGCLGEDATSDGQAPPPAPAIAASAAGAPAADLAAAASAPTEPGHPMPGPYRGRLEAAVALNAGCVSCHAEEASEWRGSHHQRSDTNPAYRKAFAIEPTAFCRGCHAPESDPTREPPRAVSELGVACVTCHVTEEGTVLAAAASGDDGGRDAAFAPHPLRRSAEFARTGGCAGCHEFRFPVSLGTGDGEYMQTTVREHQRSPAAAQGCADCHMPVVEGRRSHAFAQVRDPGWLRKNLRAAAERVDEHGVRVTLLQPAPGHAFPSGDLFRRIEVGCELRGADGKVVSRDVRHLARHFEVVPGKPGRRLVRDDRVFSGPAVVELDVTPPGPALRSGVISWWVSYQRVATVGAGTDPADAKIESEVKLHSGELPWSTD